MVSYLNRFYCTSVKEGKPRKEINIPNNSAMDSLPKLSFLSLGQKMMPKIMPLIMYFVKNNSTLEFKILMNRHS